MMKKNLWALVAGAALLGGPEAGAITVGPFGPHGEGGSKNGQDFVIGTGGSVYELDGFVYESGVDLNGSLLGTTAQLSRDSLPTNLVYQFTFGLSPDQADLVLTYTFFNAGSNAFSDLRFFVLLDAEIDETINTFFNEYGTVQGSPGTGGGDPAPNEWQIDEPGFQNGTLFRNLFLGSLDNSNSVPASALNDVAMSLGFSLGTLAAGESRSVRVMISQAQHLLGSFALTQHDADPGSSTVVTLSGLIGPGATAQVLGTVFKDSNTNGVADAGEALSGATVLLQSNQVTVAQATTDAGGKYTLNATPGNYTVQVVAGTLPVGLKLVPVTGGATNSPWPVSLAADFPQTVNFGYRLVTVPVGVVSGVVFRDANTNGVPDAGEALGGVVLLLQSNQVTVAQSTTDTGGKYSFTNAPGTYSVKLDTNTLPAGLGQIGVSSGATNNPWSVSLAANGVSVVNWGFQRLSAVQFEDVAGLAGFGLTWELNRGRGTLVGTLSVTNLPNSGVSLGTPCRLGLHASSSFFYPTNFGVAVSGLPNGVLSVDLSTMMQGRLSQGVLGPGQSVVLPNAVEIYSLTRSAPANSQFELWATPQ